MCPTPPLSPPASPPTLDEFEEPLLESPPPPLRPSRFPPLERRDSDGLVDRLYREYLDDRVRDLEELVVEERRFTWPRDDGEIRTAERLLREARWARRSHRMTEVGRLRAEGRLALRLEAEIVEEFQVGEVEALDRRHADEARRALRLLAARPLP